MAAGVAHNLNGPFGIPLIRYGYVLLMSGWGATAALLHKFASGEVPKRWFITACRDLTNATLAGMLLFLLGESVHLPPAVEAVGYTLAGYGGSRTMEMLYRKWIIRAKVNM